MDNKNLPAYPIQPTFNSEGQVCETRFDFEGLTKRELIAAMAMQGILAGSADRGVKFVVELSVKYADELLNQLE